MFKLFCTRLMSEKRTCRDREDRKPKRELASPADWLVYLSHAFQSSSLWLGQKRGTPKQSTGCRALRRSEATPLGLSACPTRASKRPATSARSGGPPCPRSFLGLRRTSRAARAFCAHDAHLVLVPPVRCPPRAQRPHGLQRLNGCLPGLVLRRASWAMLTVGEDGCAPA